MNQDCKDQIIKNFVTLIKKCDVDKLKKPLIHKGIFTEREINNIFASSDARHNKRIFFFEIQKKDRAWFSLLEALKETHQSQIVDTLVSIRRGATVFNLPQNDEDIQEICNLKNIPVNTSTTPLKIQVKLSEKFLDTVEENENVDFYKSRSKKRGRVLIINNYEFRHHEKRNGAEIDNENLTKLFNEMGGWDIDHHNNKTALEMDMIIKNFKNNKDNSLYDICFVIIMSHGSEINHDTIIYGVDGTADKNYIYTAQIQRWFSNENCTRWSTKPKIMIFSVCRGRDLQIPIRHTMRTETDSISPNACGLSMRPEEDMLICYPTGIGYKAHRDFYRGSWYIELLCQTFMNHAHNSYVEKLMRIIDQGLRTRLSENHTTQTAEFINIGFKRLYLHPGLFSENGAMEKF